MTDERVSNAIRQPSQAEVREAGMAWKAVRASLQGKPINLAIKALAHALLFEAQRASIPTTELVEFLGSMTKLYLPGGQSTLQMGDKARAVLEEGAGMPQWPSREERRTINAYLTAIYKRTRSLPVGMRLRVYYHGLMLSCERSGMTHTAMLKRLEVLDRTQRADGPPSRYMPSKRPPWADQVQ